MASDSVRCADCGAVYDLDSADYRHAWPDGQARCVDQEACAGRASLALVARAQQAQQQPGYHPALQQALEASVRWADAVEGFQQALARFQSLLGMPEPTPAQLDQLEAEDQEEYGGQEAWPVETRILDPEGLEETDLELEQQQDYSAMIGDSLQGWNQGRD